MNTVVFKILEKSHNREPFDCGSLPLNNYLKTRSGQELRKNIAFPYVMTFVGKSQVMGYYTLSATSVSISDLPANLSKLTQYKSVPAVLIGRLAVDKSLQGGGYGKLLLLNALRRIASSKVFAVMLVIVDPKDQKAVNFYKHYGFLPLGSKEGQMFLPYKTIKDL